MKIYIAGISTEVSETAADLRVIGKAKPQHVLESYYYLKNPKKIAITRERGTRIFLDSGAFTMFTQGVKIDLKEYARFIICHQDIIEVAANLDVIGNAEHSYANQKKLEGLLKPHGLNVLPVHHVLEDHDHWLLKRYLDEGHQHICLGGMVTENYGPCASGWNMSSST